MDMGIYFALGPRLSLRINCLWEDTGKEQGTSCPWIPGQTQARTINKTEPWCPSYLNSHGTWCSHEVPTWEQRASQWVKIALVSTLLLPCTVWSYLTVRTTTENVFLQRRKHQRCYEMCSWRFPPSPRWVEWFKNTSAFPLLPGYSLHKNPKHCWRGLKSLRVENAWVSCRLMAPSKLSLCLGTGPNHPSTGQNTSASFSHQCC